MNTRKGRICKIRLRVLQKTLTLNDFVMNKFSVHLIPSSMYTVKKTYPPTMFPLTCHSHQHFFLNTLSISIYNSIVLNI